MDRISKFYLVRRLTRAAYRIRGIGLGRVCEFVRCKWAARVAPESPLLIRDFRGDARFMCYLREHMGGKIFFRGSYSEDQLLLMERLLGRNSVFVDVGANQGEFSVAAARIARKVLAFEPVSEYRRRLLTNVRLNDFDNVQVYPFALSEEEGVLPIYDQKGSYSDGTRNEGLPTLFPSASRDEAREVVPVRRLDDVLIEAGIDRVDLIKLDIEGAEWPALRGAVRTVEIYRPILILEIGRETCQAAGYEPEQFIDWLRSMNYRVERIGYRGNTTPIEALEDFQNVVAIPV